MARTALVTGASQGIGEAVAERAGLLNLGIAELAWASSSKSMAACMTGSRTAARPARFWCSWTMPPAA